MLAFLTAAYPHYKMTEATAKVYLDGLVDFEPDVLAKAAKTVSHHDEFFPTVARLRSECRLVVMRTRQPGLRELLPARANPEEAKAWVEEIRSRLRGERDGNDEPR